MKKMISLLLSMLLVISMVGTAMAETTTTTVSAGSTVTMKIDLTTGGGKTAKIAISTNDAPVTFVSAAGGPTNNVVPPKNFGDSFVLFNASGVTLSSDGTSLSGNLTGYTVSNLEAGTVGTVTFKVNDDAAVGTYTVAAKLQSGSCKVDGSVTFTVTDRTPGDADGNGTVNAADALLTLKYAAKWDVTINKSNADVNADGNVTTVDALTILKYAAKWDVELK